MFATAPVITVSNGVTLAGALVAARPAGVDAGIKKAAKHLKAVAESAQDHLVKRNTELGAIPDEDSRGLDNEAHTGASEEG